jgi:hypothetical protein
MSDSEEERVEEAHEVDFAKGPAKKKARYDLVHLLD